MTLQILKIKSWPTFCSGLLSDAKLFNGTAVKMSRAMIDCMEECRLRVRVKDMGLDIFFPTIKAMVQMLEQNVDLAQGYRKIARLLLLARMPLFCLQDYAGGGF